MRRFLLPDGIDEAARTIRSGGVVAFPTDTVYGVGVDPRNPMALRRLYTIKGRDAEKPIPLLLSDANVLPRVSSAASRLARRLATAFFPGPLTLVVPLSAAFPSELNAGRNTVGVRVPDHDAARALIDACGGFLAVTSANLSGQPPATTADEVADALGERIDLLLDGGRTVGLVPSTVLDTTCDPPRILRYGAVSREELADFFRRVRQSRTR